MSIVSQLKRDSRNQNHQNNEKAKTQNANNNTNLPNNTLQHHKYAKFDLGNGRKLQIRSDFDSGNIKIKKQISKFEYELQCYNDGAFTGHMVNSKSWFYFQISGLPNGQKIILHIQRIHALLPLFHRNQSEFYKPVYRHLDSTWKRLQKSELILKEGGQPQCLIQYQHHNQDFHTIQFAFSIPYPLSKHLSFIKETQNKINNKAISFQKQVLVYSSEGRPVHILSITSKNNIGQASKNVVFSEKLFPEMPLNFNFKKPVILITGRVHPGQTSSSYTAQGIIQQLIGNDLRAELLRQLFVFVIVPMINVDGVFHGHFRMDASGNNLNRFYRNPHAQQPAISAIKQLVDYLSKQNKITAYFDLHGHCGMKGCFVYGNAFNEFVQQVQSQVFCKLYAINNQVFSYEHCIFDPDQMNAKDYFGNSKDSCGRVVVHQTAKIIHSYTIQCPIIPFNKSSCPKSSNQEFSVGQYCFKQSNHKENQLNEDTYRGLGSSLLHTLLDIFQKDPYCRIQNSKYKSMEALRRLTAFEVFHSAERFRRFQKSIFGKVRNINGLVSQIYSSRLQYKSVHNFQFENDKDIAVIDWPDVVKCANVKKKVSKIHNQISNNDTSMVVIALSQKQTQSLDLEMPNLQSKNVQESDQSDIGQGEENKEILEMCTNEKEEKDVIEKIMHDNFQASDYEQIQKKYKKFQQSRIVVQLKKCQKKNKSVIQKKDIKYYIRSKKNTLRPTQTLNISKNGSQRQPKTINYNVNSQTVESLKGIQSTQRRLTAAQQFRKNIYDTIKQQIKDGLRREYEKRKLKIMNQQRNMQSILVENNFTKNTRVFINKKEMRSRVRLPSLGPNMYIVTSSTKLLKQT